MSRSFVLGVACALAASIWVVIDTSARPAPAAAVTSPDAANFSVDPVHSSLVFKIRYSGVSTFVGRFNKFSGSFSIDDAKPESMQFDLRVQMASVDTGNERRDGHLRSADFFSAKEHPEARFVSTEAKLVEKKTFAVKGKLTLRGVTKDVTATVLYGGQVEGRGGLRSGFDGTIEIDRKAFGIEFGAGALGDTVTVSMGLTGVKAE